MKVFEKYNKHIYFGVLTIFVIITMITLICRICDFEPEYLEYLYQTDLITYRIEKGIVAIDFTIMSLTFISSAVGIGIGFIKKIPNWGRYIAISIPMMLVSLNIFSDYTHIVSTVLNINPNIEVPSKIVSSITCGAIAFFVGLIVCGVPNKYLLAKKISAPIVISGMTLATCISHLSQLQKGSYSFAFSLSVGGIIMILFSIFYYASYTNNNEVEIVEEATSEPKRDINKNAKDAADMLLKLKQLKDAGILSEEEYQAKAKAYKENL